MAKGDQNRPRRPRRFIRKRYSAHNPLDEFTMVETDPRFLVLNEGLMRDGRRGVGSYDEPGYKGILTQPDEEE